MQNSHDDSIAALIIHCIDYRFVSGERRFAKENSLKDSYDLIAYPGASKDIEKLTDAVGVSVRLHSPKKIMIVDHEDCGAFGSDNSLETHKTSLEKAKTLLQEKFPNLPVETYIAKFGVVESL
jgi:hypothetical protein